MCFSLIPPLWELCCSLATSNDGTVLGNASGGGDVLEKKHLVPLSPFFPHFSSLLSLSSLSSPFPSPFPFSFLSRSHSLFFSFPFPFLRFFFLRELLILFAPEMQGTTLLIVTSLNQLYLL